MSLLLSGLLLSACAGQPIERAEPLEVGMPEPRQRTLDISPEARQAYQQAVGHLRDDQPHEARGALHKVIEDYGDVPGAYLNLALLDYREGLFDSARTRVDKTLDLSPRNAAAYNLSGALYRRAGEFQKAREAYALAAGENYAPAHLNLAILYDLYYRHWLDAREHYRKYLALRPDDEKARLWLEDLERRIERAGG